ncbi:hypothetical protein [Acinetobacter bereziniae]|uniref:hypothetical protein n=1 Tax=Acinetobacter bereziniae TaxID=106648 RepID=UPI00300B2382
MSEKTKRGFLQFLCLAGKSLSWTGLMLVFGLVQLWTIVIQQYYLDSTKLDFLFLIKDGAFHFFCIAIISGLTIDYWLDVKRKEEHNFLKVGTFVLFPLVVIVLIVINYSVVYFNGLEFKKDDVIVVSFLSVTLLYSFLVKIYMFYRQLI